MKKSYLILSVIFLFNPILSVLDVLPDFIGYLFLLKFFHVMSYTNEDIDDLCKSIRKLTLISVLKVVSLLLMPSLVALDQAMYLVFSVIFSILECVFGIPLFVKMFEAFSKIALLEGNSVCANNDKIKKFTIGAFIARLVFAFVPDLTYLSISNGVDTPTGINLIQFRPLLITVSAFFSLIIGMVWLVYIIVYICNLLTENAVNLLKTEYKNRATGKSLLFLSKDTMSYITILCVASAFIVDFNLDLVNVLFDSIFSVTITIILIVMSVKNYFKEGIFLAIISILSTFHLAVDIILTVKVTEFFEKYNLDSILRVSKAEDMYFSICTYASISAILFVAIILLTVFSLYKNAENDLFSNLGYLTNTGREALKEEFDNQRKRNLIYVLVSSVVAAISYCCYIYFRHVVKVTTLFNSIAEIVLVLVFLKSVLYLYDNVYKRLNNYS